jgi:hypothetical protein
MDTMNMLSNNTSNNDNSIENEKTSTKDKRRSTISMLSNNSRSERDNSEYTSDGGEYNKYDYIPPINEFSINKRDSNLSTTSSITRGNAIHYSKRESTQSAFSISNSLKMEMLNSNNEEKEEKKKKIMKMKKMKVVYYIRINFLLIKKPAQNLKRVIRVSRKYLILK